jgi:hypothetical protein
MRGSCLCGQVSYQILDKPRSVFGCHCSQCRKTSGHYVAATQTLNENLEVKGHENITWYQSSDVAKRGFCKTCGSQLFWARLISNHTSVMAGTIDGDTGLKMERQLHPESKGDYYTLPDAQIVEKTAL